MFAARIGQPVQPADSHSVVAEGRAGVPGWPFAAIHSSRLRRRLGGLSQGPQLTESRQEAKPQDRPEVS
jgi:hypothetical protein